MLAVEQLFALPSWCGVSEKPRRAVGPSCPRGFRWWRKTRGSGMRQPQALGIRKGSPFSSAAGDRGPGAQTIQALLAIRWVNVGMCLNPTLCM